MTVLVTLEHARLDDVVTVSRRTSQVGESTIGLRPGERITVHDLIEAALIQSFRSAEENKKPLLAYFYEPQWFFNEMDLKRVELPPYKEGCDADAAKVDCDYPPYKLNKLMAKKFADSDSPAVDLIKNFTWTNEDQNTVSTYIAKDGMTPDDAAQKWIDDNQDKVVIWLK